MFPNAWRAGCDSRSGNMAIHSSFRGFLLLMSFNHTLNLMMSSVVPACCFHDATNVSEHQLALTLEVRTSLTCFRIFPWNTSGYEERSDSTCHGNGILVFQSGNLNDASFVHAFLPLVRVARRVL